MNSYLQDARYSLRMLRKTPAFTIIAVLSLAIGIGANTTIFSVVNAVLLRQLPGVSDPGRLVDMSTTTPHGEYGSMSYPDYEYYRDHGDVFQGLTAFSGQEAYINTGQGPEQTLGMIVSGNFFEVLGARPAVGRFFLADEDRTPGTHPVVVISYGLWQRRFAADPDAIGRSIVLNGHSYSVIGVADKEFRGAWIGLMPDIWVPMMMQGQAMPGERLGRDSRWLEVRGRLKPGVSIAQARAAVNTLASQLEQAYPETNRERGAEIRPATTLPGQVRGAVVGFMAILMAVVGLVLLIACSNVASMLLARAAARRREIAIRLAIGARRGHIIRQVLTESVLLFLLGGAAGVFIAVWATKLLLSFQPALEMPVSLDIGIDWRVLLFAATVSLVTGVVFGLSPALQSSRPDLVPSLKSDAGAGGSRGLRTRSVFVVAQVSISLVLLIGTGLFLRSLSNAGDINPGFNPDGVQTFDLNLGIQGYDERRGREFYRQLVEHTRTIPGVEGAALGRIVPLAGNVMSQGIEVSGFEPPPGFESIDIDFNIVGSQYFKTMEIPIVRGRGFSDEDREGSPRSAVVNETFARRFFPDTDAVGKQFSLGGKDRLAIVGVARDGRYETLGEDPRPYFYLPFEQSYSGTMTLHIRTSQGDLPSVLSAVRDEVGLLDKDLPLLNLLPMTERIGFSLVPIRLATAVLGVLGLLGLVLASIGVFGVVNYSVVQRTREIGIRAALGARRRDILEMVMGQGVRLALVGVVVGLGLALLLARAVTSLLYGVSASDPLIFGGIALVMVAVAAVASWFPARKATRIDPMKAMRSE
jgi:putative ABC transport system permease protein